jgi:hypothetical protein
MVPFNTIITIIKAIIRSPMKYSHHNGITINDPYRLPTRLMCVLDPGSVYGDGREGRNGICFQH